MDQVVPPARSSQPQTGIAGRLRNYFLTGLVVAGPIFVTTYLAWWFINWVDDLVRPFVPPPLRIETYLPYRIPGTGLIIAVIALTLLGFLTANFVGRKLLDIGDNIVSRMPIVRPVYRTMKQIFETLFSKTGSSFRQVALVEFPAPGMWSLVFLSQPPGADVAAGLPNSEHVSVFLPCAPNPTTGFYFYIPRKNLVLVDTPVESAMTLLLSAGMASGASPQNADQAQLAQMAANAKAANAKATSAKAVRAAAAE
jgi:uncharacterized membrane protein